MIAGGASNAIVITGGTATEKGGMLSAVVPGVRLIQDPQGEYAQAFL
jgi:hypothetical protein